MTTTPPDTDPNCAYCHITLSAQLGGLDNAPGNASAFTWVRLAEWLAGPNDGSSFTRHGCLAMIAANETVTIWCAYR